VTALADLPLFNPPPPAPPATAQAGYPVRRAMDYVRGNPGIYRRFKERANDWRRRNPGARFGAKMIVEVLRFESNVAESDGAYRLNNNHTALLARMYLAEYPEAPLETRESGLDSLHSGVWGHLLSLTRGVS
jgi:hypothetical protein